MKLVVKDSTLKSLASRVIGLIQMNTSKGVDRFGKPFIPYSTKPFAMPLGALYEYMGSKKLPKDSYKVFTTKRGSKWSIILGGYSYLKAKRFKTGSTVVNLQVLGFRGGMIGNIIMGNVSNGSISIKFKDSRASELAYYHTTAGAGKNRIIRDFFGIPESEVSRLSEEIADQILFIYP